MSFRRVALCLILGLPLAVPAATLDEARAALRGMGGLAASAVDALVPEGSAFKAPLAGANAGLQLFVVAGPDGSWQAVLLPRPGTTIEPERLWPGMGTEVFGTARLVPAAVVLSTADREVAASAWPAAVRSALGDDARTPLALKKGANAVMSLAAGSGGALGQLRQAIGLAANAPVTVRLSSGPELLAALAGAGGGESSAPYRLSIGLPGATPPAFAALDRNAFTVSFPSTTLDVSGQGRAFTLAGRQRVQLAVLGKTVALDNTLSFSKAGAAYAIACQGSADADADLFGTAAAGLSMRKLVIGGDLAASSAPGARRIAGFGATLGAVVDVAGAGPLQGDFEFEIEQNKLVELALALRGAPAGGVSLAGLPGLAALPGAAEFAFTQLALGVRPQDRQAFVYGDLRWARQGVQAAAAVLLGAREKALFFKARGLTLRKIAPGLPAEADVLALDNAVLAVSTGAMANLAPSMLPGPVRRLLAEAGAGSDRRLGFAKGVTLVTAFSPGDAGRALGVTGPLLLAGSVGGVFGDAPALALDADLGTFTLPKSAQPSFIQAKNVSPRFFVNARDLKTAAAVDLGVAVDAIVTLGRDKLDLGMSTFVTVGQQGAAVRASAGMRGDWKDPLGLAGLSLADTRFGFGFAADGTTSVSMAGKLGVGGDVFDSQNTLGLTPLGAPRFLGLSFKADRLAASTPLLLMDSLVRAAAGGPLAEAFNEADRKALRAIAGGPPLAETAKQAIPLDLVKIHAAQVLVATPGTPRDPALPAIAGTGVGVAGRLQFNGRDAGSVNAFVTETQGMRLAGDIADLELGPLLALKGSRLDVRVPLPGQGIPSFVLRGSATVLAATQSLDVELGIAKLKFVTRNDWGPMGRAELAAESQGKSLLQPTDFTLSMNAGADLKAGIRRQLVPAMLAVVDAAGGAERQALAKARADIQPLQAQLKAVRSEAGKNKRDAESGIRAAQKQVERWDDRLDGIDDDIDDLEDKIDDAKDDPAKWDKVAGWGLEVAALRTKRTGAKAAYLSAKAALKVAKEATKVVPVDAYPEVIEAQAPVTVLQAEIDTLEASLAANDGLRKVAEGIRSGANAIPVTIDELSLKNGSLAQAAKGKTQNLALKMTLDLPGKKALPLATVLKVNLLNPAATDFGGVAQLLRDAIRDVDRLLKAQAGDDDEPKDRKRKSKRETVRSPFTL